MIAGLRKLRERGVIGVNERNLRYVNALNPRRLLRSVNDKLETKKLAQAHGIPTPELYGQIVTNAELRRLPQTLGTLQDGFVIKPASGAQGNGVMVISGMLHGGYRLGNGRRIPGRDIAFHISNILSGMYSLSAQPDRAMIEYRVRFDPLFDPVCFSGVPDLRIIVIQGVPCVGMLRLPTSASDGKANLHKGGIGVGIDIATGKTGRGMQYNMPITRHPDTAEPLVAITIPRWREILTMAAQCYEASGLGYLGVDIVLDGARGPLLLELNARPGIAIQIANHEGLRHRLSTALWLAGEGLDAAERVSAVLDCAADGWRRPARA